MSCTVFLKDKDLKPKNIKKGVKIFNVVGTYEGGGGGTVVLQDKTADSSTSSQVITYDSADYDGLRQVTINPYVLDTKTVNSSTSSQTVTSDADGLSSVTVNPYVLDTKSIDASTVEQVVTSDADGLSSVTVNAALLQNRTVDASTVQVDVARTSNDYYGLRHVYINPVTSSIDSNIVAGNIKDGVTILGVTGNYSGTATDPWYVKAKKGEITDVSAYSLDEFASYSKGNAFLLAYTGITTCPQLDSSTLAESNLFGTFSGCTSFDPSAKFDASIRNIGDRAFNRTFEGSNIKDVSIYITDNLNYKYYVFDATFSTADIGDVYIKVNGIAGYDEHSNPIYGMNNAIYPFNSTFSSAGGYNIATGNVTIDVPTCVLTREMLPSTFTSCYLNSITITTSQVSDYNYYNFMPYTFQSATINNLSIPNLSEGHNALFNYTCDYAHIKNLNVHPYVLSVYNGSEETKFAYNADILAVTLTADATDNIYLEYCENLSTESVLNILSHLDLTVSGKDVYFYSNGLTVLDDGGYIKDAYEAATAAGWTIHNLTINTINTVRFDEQVINLDNGNTIGFSASGSWTASVDDPSVTLSAYSGNAGQSQSVTVSIASGWEGSTFATFTCKGVTNNMYIVKGNYTRLSYISIGGTPGQYCDTGVNLTSESKLALDYAATYTNGGKILTTTNYTENEWRIFGYGYSLYFDLGGGDTVTDGRIEISGYADGTRYNLEFGKFYIKNIDTSSEIARLYDNPFTSTNGDTLKLGGAEDTTNIYELKFYVDGTNLSHDFIPVTIGTLVCFYDTVNSSYMVPNTGSLTGA